MASAFFSETGVGAVALAGSLAVTVEGAVVAEIGVATAASSAIYFAKDLKDFQSSGTDILKGYGSKTESYIAKRGWTWDSMKEVVNKPYTTREAVNKGTGNAATAYYNKDGDYVVVDNITDDLVQTSKFGDSSWIPDATIKNPYKP